MFCSFTYTLSEPAAISASATITNSTSCSNPDGTISLAVSGGTGSYTYSLDGNTVFNPINGLSAGTFSIEVTDANGVFDFISETVNEPAAPQIATNFTDPSCFGADDAFFRQWVLMG